MPATIQPNPLPASPGINPSVVAVATSVQLSRIGQATRSGQGQTGAMRLVTADGFVSSTDTWIGADCTANAVTMTLPLVSAYRANIYEFEQYAAGHTFTVACQGTDKIDGSSTATVTKLVKVFPVGPGNYHLITIGS